MACPERYDLQITAAGETHGLVCDWARGGAGLQVSDETPKSTRVATKGEYGVKDANDYMRIIQSDWSGGCGQETFDLQTDLENAFASSRYIDTGTVGEFGLAPSIAREDFDTLLPVCASGLLDSTGTPVVFTARSGGKLYYSDGDGWNAVSFSGSDPTNDATCLCSDGDYMYAAMGGSGIWRGRATTTTDAWSQWSASTGVTKIAFASGILYGSKGSYSADAQIGTFTGALNAWAELSPTESTAINAYGTTFGLVASGNFIYWGVTNGVVTKVYKALFAGGTNKDTLQEVCSFPSGFIGGCMYAYLGSVYVGGHFDSRLPATGIGAIYEIINDTPALLTDVGTDKEQDNRVRSICAYERSLYFISGQDVWRWDLKRGGYSHWTGPVTPGELFAYTSINWDGIWEFTHATSNTDWRSDTEPAGSVTVQTNGCRVKGVDEPAEHDVLTLLMPADSSFIVESEANSAASKTDDIDDSVGVTVGLTYKAVGPSGILAFGVTGSESIAWVELKTIPVSPNAGIYRIDGVLYSGAYKLGEFYNVPSGAEVLVTLRHEDGKPIDVRAYVDGVLAAKGTGVPYSSPNVTPKKVWFRATNQAVLGANIEIAISQMRWSTGGAYMQNNWISIGGADLACVRDDIWISSTADAVYRTSDALSLTGEMVSSRSAGNMPTVDKWFHAIQVQLKGALRSGESVTVDGYIDGNYFRGEAQATDSDTLVSYAIGRAGRNISYKVSLGLEEMSSALTQGPIVTDVSVLFTMLPKTAKVYSYYVRCWKGARSNLPNAIWDEDPDTVSEWLESVVNTIVTVSRPGRSDFTAKFEGLQYVEAPPAVSWPGREGIYKLDLRRMD